MHALLVASALVLAAPPGPSGPAPVPVPMGGPSPIVIGGIPIVRMTILPGDSAAAPSRLFAETLPRNTAFVVELAATTLTQSGLLRVWPSMEQEPDCYGSGGKQSYCLPMTLETSGGRPVLRTTVPQLQSGIPFVFKVEQYDSLLQESAGSLARGVASLILTPLEEGGQPDPPPCDPENPSITKKLMPLLAPKVSSTSGNAAAVSLTDALGAAGDDPVSREGLEAALATVLGAEMNRRGISGDPSHTARVAIDDFYVTPERKMFVTRHEELEAKLNAVEAAQVKVCAVFSRAYRAAQLIKANSPIVYLDQKLVPVSQFFDAKKNGALLDDSHLSAAASQLAVWKMEMPIPPGVQHPSEPWRKALESLVALPAADRPAAASAIDPDFLLKGGIVREEGMAPIPVVPIGAVVWHPAKGKLVMLTTALSDFERLKPAAIRAQIESVRTIFVGANVTHANTLINALRDLADAMDDREKAYPAVAQARAARDQVFQGTREALVRSLNSMQVTSAMRTLRKSEGRSDPKLLRTPSAGSFASPDVGAFVAAPLLRARGKSETGIIGDEPWVLPYAGLNLYLEPVERDLPLNQLVEARPNGWFSRQRWSGTIGFVFRAEPKIPGRRVEGAFLEAYPVVGIGYRVTPYLRLTGGAVGYQILDANPASGRASYAAAPFVGASIDTDLVSMLFNAGKGLGK